jgi:hypothetical protein
MGSTLQNEPAFSLPWMMVSDAPACEALRELLYFGDGEVFASDP